MNGKKAKAARRIARIASVGMKDGELMISNKTGNIKHAKNTTRHIYQSMKKGMKK